MSQTAVPLPTTLDPVDVAAFHARRQARAPAGDTALFVAVLEEALHEWRQLQERLDGGGDLIRARYDQLRCWFRSTSTAWPCAFESLCEVLEFDADIIRGQLGLDRDLPPRDAGRPPVARILRTPRPGSVVARVLACLATGPQTREMLGAALGVTTQQARDALAYLRSQGRVDRRGAEYKLASGGLAETDAHCAR